MTGRGRRGAPLLIATVLLAALPARAALITINDCTNDPHIQVQAGGHVVIDVGADDLELACSLTPPSPSSNIDILGHNILITGDVRFPGRPSGDAIVIAATGTLEVMGAAIEALNPIGSMRITAVAGMTFRAATLRTGQGNRFGYDMRVLCTGPRCAITARQSTFTTRRLAMTATSDIYFGLVKVTTNGPRDRIDILSSGGAALMSGCGNVFRSGQEGRMNLEVCKNIDLAFANIDIGRDIDITTTGSCGGDLDTSIRLTGTTVRNDFGKTGDIVVTAAGQAQINICGAVLIDDGPDVSELNGREAVPHEPFNNVLGPPDIDD